MTPTLHRGSFRLPSPLLAALAAAGAVLARPDVRAQAANGPPAVSVVATPVWVSQDLFRGQRLSGPAFQPSVEADYAGVALGVWTNFPIGGKVRDPAALPSAKSDPEIDVYGSNAISLSPSLSLQPGFTVYTYPDADPLGAARPVFGQPNATVTGPGNFRATFEPSLALNWTLSPVRISPKVYYDTVLRSFTGEVDAVAALPLRSVGSELDLGATLGAYDMRSALDVRGAGTQEPSGAFEPFGDVRRSGGYGLVQVSLPYQLGAHTRASATYAYTAGFDTRQTVAGRSGSGPNPLAASRGFVTVSLAYTF
ncbi:MAG: hypothetical protein ACREFX_11725 [Opitutaceae bacterium]